MVEYFSGDFFFLFFFPSRSLINCLYEGGAEPSCRPEKLDALFCRVLVRFSPDLFVPDKCIWFRPWSAPTPQLPRKHLRNKTMCLVWSQATRFTEISAITTLWATLCQSVRDPPPHDDATHQLCTFHFDWQTVLLPKPALILLPIVCSLSQWGGVHQFITLPKVAGILCPSSAWCPLNEGGQPRQFALALHLMELQLRVEDNRLFSHDVTGDHTSGSSVEVSRRGRGWLKQCSPQVQG